MNQPIDDEMAARIQEFTTWAVGKGYHLIGMLAGPAGAVEVKVFCTAPCDPHSDTKEYVKKMADLLHHTIHKGTTKSHLSLTLGNN